MKPTQQELLMVKILNSISDNKTDSTDWVRVLVSQLTDSQTKDLLGDF